MQVCSQSYQRSAEQILLQLNGLEAAMSDLLLSELADKLNTLRFAHLQGIELLKAKHKVSLKENLIT